LSIFTCFIALRVPAPRIVLRYLGLDAARVPRSSSCTGGESCNAPAKLLLILFVCVGCADTGNFSTASNAAAKGNYAAAAQLYRPLADQGDARAQTNLGFMYERGQGVPQDFAIAASWYRKAAEQGRAEAQANLGKLYYSGQGVPQDFAMAASWVGKAAAKGMPTPSTALASCTTEAEACRGTTRQRRLGGARLPTKATPKPENNSNHWLARLRQQRLLSPQSPRHCPVSQGPPCK
jgi:hypothetical protein